MFKAFIQPCLYIMNNNGSRLSRNEEKQVKNQLKKDVIMVTDLAEHFLDKDLLDDLDKALAGDELGTNKYYNAKIGQFLGVKMPKEISQGRKAGNSRLEHIFQHKVISEAKSWLARSKATNKESDKYVSTGWKRTSDDTRPTKLNPKISISAGSGQYGKISIVNEKIHLHLVIRGTWYILVFNKPSRFANAKKFTLPDITVTADGDLKFNFTAEIEEKPLPYSPTYIVGVDVGITNFIVVSVIEAKNRKIVYSSGLSRATNSLYNSILATKRQVEALYNKADGYKELAEQRQALSRKRRELAIRSAQEIVEISRIFDNALIAVEDLSHIKDTMKFGRWNRGELLHWINNFSAATGTKIYSVNPANTSQTCYYCGEKVSHPKYSLSYCKNCKTTADRDVNAAANIALRFHEKRNKEKESVYKKALTNQKAKAKRSNPKQLKPRIKGGSANTQNAKRDRTKNAPTAKKIIRKIKTNISAVQDNLIHTVWTDVPQHGGQDSKKATLKIVDSKPKPAKTQQL